MVFYFPNAGSNGSNYFWAGDVFTVFHALDIYSSIMHVVGGCCVYGKGEVGGGWGGVGWGVCVGGGGGRGGAEFIMLRKCKADRE